MRAALAKFRKSLAHLRRYYQHMKHTYAAALIIAIVGIVVLAIAFYAVHGP